MVVRDFRGELEITDVLAVTAGFRVSVGQHDAEPGESAVEGTSGMDLNFDSLTDDSELTVVFESSRARIRITCSGSDDVRKVVSEVKLLAVIASERLDLKIELTPQMRIDSGTGLLILGLSPIFGRVLRVHQRAPKLKRLASRRTRGGSGAEIMLHVRRELARHAHTSASTVDDKETGNPLDPSFQTVQWLQKKLGAREGDFSQRKPLRYVWTRPIS